VRISTEEKITETAISRYAPEWQSTDHVVAVKQRDMRDVYGVDSHHALQYVQLSDGIIYSKIGDNEIGYPVGDYLPIDSGD